MSEEIDWDKILSEPEAPKPEVSKEDLWVQLDRMKRLNEATPRWAYFKMLMVLAEMALSIGVAGWMWAIPDFTPLGFMLVIITIHLYILGDHFVMLWRTTRR